MDSSLIKFVAVVKKDVKQAEEKPVEKVVEAQADETPRAPTIIEKVDQIKAKENETVVIKVKVDAFPKPTSKSLIKID